MAIATTYSDRPGLDLCYQAGEVIADQTLRSNDSIFTPGVSIWTLENLRDLYDRFVNNPDQTADSFEVKFKRQLSGAPDETIQLAGELLYIHLLFPVDITGKKKRSSIETVLSWSSSPVTIPQKLNEALDSGFVKVGMAYTLRRPMQLWLLLEYYVGWKSLGLAEQATMLEDPWVFKAWLWRLPQHGAQPQRQALLHLVHPETFEDIVSGRYKRLISSAFNERVITQSDDLDRQLLEIRESLTKEAGHPVNFYIQPLLGQWKNAAAPTLPISEGIEAPKTQRAWLVRGANVDGHNLVPTWLAGGYCSVQWGEIGDIPQGTPRATIAGEVDEAYPDDPSGSRSNHVGNLDRFINKVAAGDLIVTPDGAKVYVGTVTSGPGYFPSSGGLAPRRRNVHWANADSPIPREDLSPSAFSKLRTLLTVSELTEDVAEYALLSGIDQEGESDGTLERVHLSAPDEALASRMLFPRKWLDEVVGLLDEKRQVVFYGPPGTGKTWTAMELANHLTRAGGEVLTIQFHPSYAYEDFIEGFRPRAGGDGATVQFELVPGPLRQLADVASKDRAHPYFLIIDELNRANLAKVFGELYFLLEYRDISATLQYSPSETFTLPDNLFIIGTMNTADRSIALVDAAMRRRFYFVPFLPDKEPIKDLLRCYLKREAMNTLPADVLEELNRRIDDSEAAVGPSYLMNEAAGTPEGLDRIWRHAILPLLAEHFYGQDLDIEQRFGLASLLRAQTSSSDDTEEPDVEVLNE